MRRRLRKEFGGMQNFLTDAIKSVRHWLGK
jgi:hypothetical protein